MRHFLYGSYDSDELHTLLNKRGGVVLLNPGTYELEKLGVPFMLHKSLEIMGVNGASRDTVVVNVTRDADWGLVVSGVVRGRGGSSSKKKSSSKNSGEGVCWLRLAHLTLQGGECGEGVICLRPGFTGSISLKAPVRSADDVATAAHLYDVALKHLYDNIWPISI